MSPDNHGRSPHESLHCCWLQELTKRRKFNKYAENEAYIQFLDAEFDNGGEDVDEIYGDDDNIDFSNENGDPFPGPSDRSEDQTENANGAIDAEAFSRPKIVRLFMKGMLGDEDKLPFRDQPETVARFCEKESTKLDSGSVGKNTKTVALLDDRNDGGIIFAKEGNCRPYLGPLNSQQLRNELSRQVGPFLPRPKPSIMLTLDTALQSRRGHQCSQRLL